MADLTTLANVKAWLELEDRAVTGITQANPGVVTCASHNLRNGARIILSGVLGMTQINGVTLTVTVVDANSFSAGVNTSTYGAYVSGGLFGADDVLLSRLITSVSASVEQYLGRKVLSESHSETLTMSSGQIIAPKYLPILSVESVQINGEPIPASPDGQQDGYVFDDACIYLNGYQISNGRSRYLNVWVRYTAGYATTPTDLEQAVIHLVAARYREKERIGMRSKVLGGETVNYLVADMPPDVQAVLSNYRRVIV